MCAFVFTGVFITNGPLAPISMCWALKQEEQVTNNRSGKCEGKKKRTVHLEVLGMCLSPAPWCGIAIHVCVGIGVPLQLGNVVPLELGIVVPLELGIAMLEVQK